MTKMNIPKRPMLMAVVLLSVLAGCTAAQSPHTLDFEQADIDRDSQVSFTEWLRFGGGEASYVSVGGTTASGLGEAQFRQAQRLNDEISNSGSRRQLVLDEQIRGEIRKTFDSSRNLNSMGIKTEVYQGNVTLSGRVASAKEKSLAENLASSVQGVAAVFNQIVVTY